MAIEKIKRSAIAHFLDTSKAADYADATWKRVGKNVDSASTEYNPQTETEQDIISESATTELTGYQPTMPISQKCTKGDEVYEFVNGLRRKRSTMSDAHTWLLNVDLYDKTGSEASATYAAEVQEVSVQVDTYGGDGGESPVLEYTLNYVGDPIPGTVSITSGTPTFTRTA